MKMGEDIKNSSNVGSAGSAVGASADEVFTFLRESFALEGVSEKKIVAKNSSNPNVQKLSQTIKPSGGNVFYLDESMLIDVPEGLVSKDLETMIDKNLTTVLAPVFEKWLDKHFADIVKQKF